MVFHSIFVSMHCGVGEKKGGNERGNLYFISEKNQKNIKKSHCICYSKLGWTLAKIATVRTSIQLEK